MTPARFSAERGSSGKGRCSVAACIVTHNRPADLAAALDSIVAQPFDEVLVCDMGSNPPAKIQRGERLIRCDENLGYPAGRNRIAREARSDILLFIDDDASLLGESSAETVRGLFSEDPRLGAVAGRVLRADGATVSSEFPFRGAPSEEERARPCAYFVGTVHAVRRDAWTAVGGLDERYFYSTEELDLAFGLLAAGWRIWYEPRLLIEHRPSPRGRIEGPRLPALRLRNRLLLVRRHLPWPIAFIHAAAWGWRTFRQARRAGDTRPWREAWQEGLHFPVARAPLRYAALLRVHRLGGRVLW